MALTDVVSLSRAKQWFAVGPVDASQDAQLAAAITAASQWMDVRCGPVIQRTVTGEVLHGGGAGYVQVRQRPVASFTSVTGYASGVATVLTAETDLVSGSYLAEPWPGQPPGLLSGRLYRRLAFDADVWPVGTVKVTYVAGRYATTAAAVDTRFEVAGLMVVAWLLRSQVVRSGTVEGFDVPTVGDTGDVPNAVKELLEDEWAAAGSVPRAEGRVGSIRLGVWSMPETATRAAMWGTR